MMIWSITGKEAFEHQKNAIIAERNSNVILVYKAGAAKKRQSSRGLRDRV